MLQCSTTGNSSGVGNSVVVSKPWRECKVNVRSKPGECTILYINVQRISDMKTRVYGLGRESTCVENW